MSLICQRLFLISIVLLASFAVTAQENSATGNKAVVWKVVNNNDEFAIAIPDGFETFVDGDYWIGNNIEIKKHVSVTRLLNGVFLMVEMYEGNPKDIQKELVSRLTRGDRPYRLTKDEIRGGVPVKEFDLASDNRSRIQQFYLFKKRLIVVQTIAPDEKNPVAGAFLESVQLGNGTITKKPSRDIIEIPATSDDETFQEKPDREIVVLYKPRPHYTTEARVKGVTGEVVIKALFSATGTISGAQVVSGPKELRQLALEALAGIRFLPAEKDGKLVTMWKQISYSFSIY